MSQIKKNLTEDLTSLQTRINEYCAAWTTQAGEPDWLKIEQLYADEDLLHYDAVTPHSFANVAGMKEAFAQMKKGLCLTSLELKARENLNVFRHDGLLQIQALIINELAEVSYQYCPGLDNNNLISNTKKLSREEYLWQWRNLAYDLLDIAEFFV